MSAPITVERDAFPNRNLTAVIQPIDDAASEKTLIAAYKDGVSIHQEAPDRVCTVFLDCEETLLATAQACLGALENIRAKKAKENTT